jgi:hypothetical protein
VILVKAFSVHIAARISPFLIAFAVTCAFFIDFCAWISQCGCRSLWRGADAACNVHAMVGHHCPWCSHGHLGQAIVMLLISAPQLAVAWLPKWGWGLRTAVAVAMFPVVGGVVAIGFGWVDGYWLR